MKYDEFAERKELDVEHLVKYAFLVHDEEDADIVMRLKHANNRTEYIKKLIRQDIEKRRVQKENQAEKARRKEQRRD